MTDAPPDALRPAYAAPETGYDVHDDETGTVCSEPYVRWALAFGFAITVGREADGTLAARASMSDGSGSGHEARAVTATQVRDYALALLDLVADDRPDGRYRVGRKLGRTLYWQPGAAPSDDDRFLGLLETPSLAADVVDALNRAGHANDRVREDARRRVDDIVRETSRQIRAVEQGRDRAVRERDELRAAR